MADRALVAQSKPTACPQRSRMPVPKGHLRYARYPRALRQPATRRRQGRLNSKPRSEVSATHPRAMSKLVVGEHWALTCATLPLIASASTVSGQWCERFSSDGQRPVAGMSRRSVMSLRHDGVSKGLPQ